MHHSVKSFFLKTQTFSSDLPGYCRYTGPAVVYAFSSVSVIPCRLYGHMNSLHSAGLKVQTSVGTTHPTGELDGQFVIETESLWGAFGAKSRTGVSCCGAK